MLKIFHLMMFGMPGPLELIIVLIIVLLVVGPKKLPELMKSVGKSINSFKKGMKEDSPNEEESDSKKSESDS